MKITTNFIKQTKRHFSASGSILLPLALKWRLVTVALCALAASVLPTIISSSAHAASLTITIPKNTFTVNVSADTNGGFNTASGKLTVSGDAAWGYTLTVKSGNSDNSNNLRIADGNNSLPSITAPITLDTTNSNFPTNKWGYKPSKKDSAVNTQYLPGPTSTETTIDKTNTAIDATGTTYDFTLAAKVDATQPAGTYSGSFTFTAVANAINYNITYDCNGTTSCIENTTGQTQEKTTQLSSQEPTKDGYNFLGWCTTQPTPDKYSEDGCLNSGRKYDKNGAFELTNSANNVTLYAMWQKQLTFEEVYAANGKTKYNNTNYYAMQDMGTDFCEHVTVPSEKSEATLIDVRDNNKYTVAKLLDGRCWMTQNLAIGSNEKETVLKPETSDIREEFTLPQGSIKTGTAEDKNSGWHAEQYDTEHIWISENKENGGYYTWYTATAGEGTEDKSTGDTQKSICPRGWHLPNGTEMIALTGKYTTETAEQKPANFLFSGLCDNAGCPRQINTYGYWWSATVKDNKSARPLFLGNKGFYLDNWDASIKKGRGFTIRCISSNE